MKTPKGVIVSPESSKLGFAIMTCLSGDLLTANFENFLLHAQYHHG